MKVELCNFPLQKLSLFPLCYRMGPSTLTWCSGSFLILATYLLPVMSQTWTLVKVEYLLIAKTLVCNFHFPPLLVRPFGLKSPLLPTNFCAYPCLWRYNSNSWWFTRLPQLELIVPSFEFPHHVSYTFILFWLMIAYVFECSVSPTNFKSAYLFY